MKIVVYGPGCARCHEAERVVRQAVEELGVAAEIEKIGDYMAMAIAGVLGMPAISVDGTLKCSGRVPRAEEVQRWLSASGASAD